MFLEPSFRSPLRLTLIVAAALALAACETQSSGLGGESAGWAPPPEAPESVDSAGSALSPPGAAEGESGELPAAASQAPSSEEAEGEVPEGEAADGESAEGAGPVVYKGPDGTTWRVSKKTDEATYQADIEDCYGYAVAQVQRDQRIDDDRKAGLTTLGHNPRFDSVKRKNTDQYEQRNRRGALLTECMEAKGYDRADDVFLPRVVF